MRQVIGNMLNAKSRILDITLTCLAVLVAYLLAPREIVRQVYRQRPAPGVRIRRGAVKIGNVRLKTVLLNRARSQDGWREVQNLCPRRYPDYSAVKAYKHAALAYSGRVFSP